MPLAGLPAARAIAVQRHRVAPDSDRQHRNCLFGRVFQAQRQLAATLIGMRRRLDDAHHRRNFRAGQGVGGPWPRRSGRLGLAGTRQRCRVRGLICSTGRVSAATGRPAARAGTPRALFSSTVKATLSSASARVFSVSSCSRRSRRSGVSRVPACAAPSSTAPVSLSLLLSCGVVGDPEPGLCCPITGLSSRCSRRQSK